MKFNTLLPLQYMLTKEGYLRGLSRKIQSVLRFCQACFASQLFFAMGIRDGVKRRGIVRP